MQTGHTRDTGFFAAWDKVGTLVLVNLLWFLCSLPIVTLPASTAALFSVVVPMMRGRAVEPFAEFAAGFRDFWRKSTLIGLLDLCVFGLIYANFAIFGQMDGDLLLTRISQVVTLFALVAACFVNLYLWVLLVTFRSLSIQQLIENAFRMAFAHALWTLFLFAVIGAGLLVSALFPAMFAITITASASAAFISWGSWRIIRRYVDPAELIRLERSL